MSEVENLGTEQNADLRALEMMAAEQQPAQAGGVEPAPAADPAETWAVLPAMIGSTLAIAMPELRAVYTPEACRAWGEAMAPVAEKYGWSADGLIGPEMGLVAASLPFMFSTTAAIKAKRAELAKGQGEPAPSAPTTAGQKTVTFGAAVHENG